MNELTGGATEKPRVAIRVDASESIGLGHLIRCINMAIALRARGAACEFYCAQRDELVQSILAKRGFSFVALGVEIGSTRDRAAFTASLGATTLVILDGYAFDAHYMAALRAAGAYVCVVDDLGDRVLDCDSILNHNFYAVGLTYRNAPVECLRLLGPHYGIVGDDFVVARGQHVSRREANRVLIVMGGADPTRETEKSLRALAHLAGSRLDVRVVIGPANPFGVAIERAAVACVDHAVTLIRAPEDLAAQMVWCDVALSASGMTCMELACVSVPAIVVAVAENQRAVADALQRGGLMRSLGWHADVGEETLANALRDLLIDFAARNKMYALQRNAIDGLGKERAADALLASWRRSATQERKNGEEQA